MKRLILTIFISLYTVSTYCQPKESGSKFNFDFEAIEKGTPTGWSSYGSSSYTISIDSSTVKSGRNAATIEYIEGKPDFRAWAFTIPHNYEGNKITISGYIKTEDVTNGYAGLWMRIDPSVGFNNMNRNGVKGTTDWTKYDITLTMDPKKTKQVVIGGLLIGKGKMWIDDLKVTIDGIDIKELKPIEKEVFPAELDKEFDKGSSVTSLSINEKQVDNLKTLGLIWGFLKYYHPNIAQGRYNWDYELFRVLPKLIKAESKQSRDELLVSWINGLGAFSDGNDNSVVASEIKIAPDLEWITTSGYSSELSSLLLKIKRAKRPKDHYYIRLYEGVGNPEFKNENDYFSMKYPDAGFRLLSLFRYWNSIQYYFPYRNLIEENWKEVLKEFIPKFIEVKDEIGYELAVLELISRIHDNHAVIGGNIQALLSYNGRRIAPVKLTFIENAPVVTGYYDEKLGMESGLKNGDIITTINNRPVEDIVKGKLKYTSASNYPTKLRNITYSLLMTNDTTVAIEYDRNGRQESKTLKTFTDYNFSNQDSDTCFKLVRKDIAYINHETLKKRYLPTIWEEMKDTRGLIIDIRNYPTDFPLYELSSYLIPESTPFAKFSVGSIETPGLFSFTKPLNAGGVKNGHYKGKVVILINEVTQSSSEFHTMAYRVHPNAIVVGSTTAGADGNISQFVLPGGIHTVISGIGVYYPDGKETQRIGIVPDIELRPTIQGVREGRDELLEKAIEIINEQ